MQKITTLSVLPAALLVAMNVRSICHDSLIKHAAIIILVLWQVEVHRVEAGRSEGNLLYLLHVYCDTLSRLLEKHGFTGFGKYALLHSMLCSCVHNTERLQSRL